MQATVEAPVKRRVHPGGLDEAELLRVLVAFDRGDFEARLPVDMTGKMGKIADVLNSIMDRSKQVATETERIAKTVGRDGRISQRAELADARGSWAEIVNSVNDLIGDMAKPMSAVGNVIDAVSKGDLSQTMSLEFEGRAFKGEFLRIGKAVNLMVGQLNSFASEVTRVAREVGTEGKLGGQAEAKGVSGTWKDLTENVNMMASNLTSQVRNIADVTIAVANGDLTRKITVDVRGEFLQLKDGINTMVDQLNGFAAEVTRVAREVGTEGKLGGQAAVPGISGTWKDLTDNVNMMAANLTGQVRNIADVTTAVARGDLTRKITVDARGEILELKSTINTMVDQLNSFASEVTRVAREVGTDGKLGGQAEVKGVGGTWKDLTESVNMMASNLTSQVRNIAEVTTAVANGDLARKITVDAQGEILELKSTINTMVDQLSTFASEVTRVAREVGAEGQLGGQAKVQGVSGTWKDLTDNVNMLAANLTNQVRNIAEVTTAVANGDLTRKITVDAQGEILELKKTVNTMVDQLNSFASEVTRVAREVGAEGQLGGQAKVKGVGGTWKDLTESVNMMASNLTNQVRNIAEVTTAVANGDLTRKITVDAQGEILELKKTVNTMVDQLSTFASEVTRVAREVGAEGQLGGQAKVKDVGGTWKDLTNNVNMLAANLTNQVRNIAEVTTAVANGDLARKITVDAKGEILELKKTVNTMVDQLSTFASEVTRVAREVGAEGQLGGQAEVKGVGGTWKDLTDNVNMLAANLTNQVRNIAEVTTAVANGDLSKKITVDAQGEILELKRTVNTMVDQLSTFASEVTRVAREVGAEGQLGGQAEVSGVGGTWKDLTDNVNMLAANLTNQVRNIAEVTTAVANGDLARKITVDAKGEILELKDTINTMVDQLSTFASEVTRVAREVGAEGQLGGQAEVKGVGGTWKDLTDNVNMLAANLTNQVRNIAEVTTAVANGDLARKITVDAKGEILELKDTINTMVDQLSTFASEVTRVAREVGTDGKLGGQAEVKGVDGTWKDLTESVNMMASNLTNQVRNIADVTIAVANGDLSKKITADVRGELLQLKEAVNMMVDQLNAFAAEVSRVAREVGTAGKLGGQAAVPGASGTWKDLTDNVNMMAANLTNQVRNIANVTTAVANGDLTRKITVDAQGEILELKNTINTMVDQLSTFAAEVTRVAREVGTEGRLGGQGEVKGVSGTWKDLTDSVNFMAANLTAQVRGIAKVVTAVASGDLRKKLTVEAKGEVAALADTINEMTDTLATFADQVVTVAREVGVEGKLGGQASVPGAAGTWRDLTDNVNELAANLTTQVRAMGEVARAVTSGDLSSSITVEARGEVEQLKNNVNEMIANLRQTTLKTRDQDWLKTNLAKFSNMLQGQRDLATVANLTLTELAPLVSAQHGIFYYLEDREGTGKMLKLQATYAFQERKNLATSYRIGEGLVGECAREKQRILLTSVPSDYVRISSGLGEATPANVCVLPVVFEDEVIAVIELASFERFTEIHLSFLEQLMESLGVVLNTIQVNMRTEGLLEQSQSMAEELQSQQDRLQQTNEELGEKAQLLEEQNEEVAKKNQEVEHAKLSLEEKARQLEVTSKYKSEFLANMSHELRTPLNSILLLSEQLSHNDEGNLGDKQVKFAETINTSGQDLLGLINDVLDLAKIESGTVTLSVEEVTFAHIADQMSGMFEHLAESKGLGFGVSLNDALHRCIRTDGSRLLQVLRNLLSNAVKFTEKGRVDLCIEPASAGWSPDVKTLDEASEVVAFAVKDTGVGIPHERQMIVFEAFQQADGGTSRKFGGTGLGLSISREIARMLGGDLTLHSTEGEGSTFTLYLPSEMPVGSTRGRDGQTVAVTQVGERASVPATTAAVGSGTDVVSAVRTSEARAGAAPATSVEDDRADIGEGDRAVLVVEDDVAFACVLRDMARQSGFKSIVATTGEEALTLVHEFEPMAITLDIQLPDIDGWTVLDRLKLDPRTRHIPVQVITIETERTRSLRRGAIAFVQKPVDRAALEGAFARIVTFAGSGPRRLLVVDGAVEERDRIVDLIGNGDIEIKAVGTGAEALKATAKGDIGCVVVAVNLPDMTGLDLIGRFGERPATRDVPVVLYSEKALTKRQAETLEKVSANLVVKEASSPERLVDETALFLHRVAADLPEDKRLMIEQLYSADAALAGKRILVVDDDVRNIFALTSVLESHRVEVLSAENGGDALSVLASEPRVDAVLMDVMMPGMDGYETTEAIRQMPQFRKLPVIALTAKAMKDDRDKCIAAGASDYITKPVDAGQLLSLLRVWLH